MGFQDKVAVVTGGATGIGEAICVRIGEEGGRVAVLDLNAAGAELTAGLCRGAAYVADVADGPAVEAAFARIERELGPIDVLVNNAGIAGRAQSERLEPKIDAQIAEAGAGKVETGLDGLAMLPYDEWRQMLAVHVDGTFHCSQAAVRSMRERRRGAIVNVASICGLEGCPGHPHYSAAKGAILAFTRAVAKELIVQGIRMNAVAPGFVETPMTSVLTPAQKAGLEMRIPAGRLATPAEIAAGVVFLASDDASYCVGVTLSANGGLVTV
jgi:3-oxoacyl-[acyl-carrier protein] reductase